MSELMHHHNAARYDHMRSRWNKGKPKPQRVYMTGEEMRRIREDMGVTQEELGRLLGAHNVSISNWERGVWPITEKTARFLRRIR
jgi:DNA-binding transcriptional regulator YiaG